MGLGSALGQLFLVAHPQHQHLLFTACLFKSEGILVIGLSLKGKPSGGVEVVTHPYRSSFAIPNHELDLFTVLDD